MLNHRWGSCGARLGLMRGLLAGALLLTACQSSGAGPSETRPASVDTARGTETSRASEFVEPSEAEDDPVAAYLAFWDAVEAAGNPPDPDHPDLEATAADPQLSQLRNVLSDYRQQGHLRRGDNEHHPELRQLLDDERAAIVDDCSELDPEGGLYDAETGERIEGGGEPGDRELLEARLELIDGTWKVANVNVVEEDSTCEPSA